MCVFFKFSDDISRTIISKIIVEKSEKTLEEANEENNSPWCKTNQISHFSSLILILSLSLTDSLSLALFFFFSSFYINTHRHKHTLHTQAKKLPLWLFFFFQRSPINATTIKECMFDANCNQGKDKLFVITIVQDGYVYVLF